MNKLYTALGLMSGTSGDGVDASIIKSDGISSLEVIFDNFFEYDISIYDNIHKLKDKINNRKNITDYAEDLKSLEREITLFHAKVVKKVLENRTVDLIGFHGQTIYHNSKEKISKQLGDAKLLFQLIKKKVVYNFRERDLQNEGEGAPLTPIYHHLILKKKKVPIPACILNIGGISNITVVNDFDSFNFTSKDIGPGNCLIDKWVRKNSKKKFDENGRIASTGIVNEIILEQAQELYANRPETKNLSFDVNDFDVSFARGLSLEDGCATLTEFTSGIISASLNFLEKKAKDKKIKVLVAGGGRKNKILIKKIKDKLSDKIQIESIDTFKIDGDFIESQAFAFLAIRSILNLPISFPSTTGCIKPCTGGDILDF